MRRREGQRKFDCLVKPSDLNVQQEKTEKAIALAILRSLASNSEVQITAEHLVRCETELKKIYCTK